MQGLILYGHQPVKDNPVYNDQEKQVFLNSSSIMRARRLQETVLPRMLRAAKDERHSLRFFNDCSSLSVPETPS